MQNNKRWLKHYPPGVPFEVRTDQYPSLVALLEESFRKHQGLPAYRFMGRAYSFGRIDELSRAFAAWLQGLALARGDRVAVMLPNLPQYPVVVTGILRAGLVVVNVNPLYTARELALLLKDSGAKAIVVLENFAATLQQAASGSGVPTKHVVLAAIGDLLGPLKGALANHAVRRVKKLVSAFDLPGAVRFNTTIERGRRRVLEPPQLGPQDIALLQYTGGTTGASKAAVLLHGNLVANLLQSQAWHQPVLKRIPPGQQIVMVGALPLFHIFGFNGIMMLALRAGACVVLIANPRDIGGLLKQLARQPFHSFPAINTLFSAIARHPDFDRVDWSSLKLSVGGGMAVQETTARLWFEKTGCRICEGYGLTETSPSAACNPVDGTAFNGSIGVPLPSTELALLDDEGRELGPGAAGEIAIRGPQVMAGYWQRPDETAKVMTADGWLRTGDIGVMDERGYFRIVDRKKDMIVVSGFNVYPNEIEEVVTQVAGVLECAAVGMPDDAAGEAVKLFVVRTQNDSASPSEAELRAYCQAHLTGYKRPKVIEFRDTLPKSAVGKVLRRELRGSVNHRTAAP